MKIFTKYQHIWYCVHVHLLFALQTKQIRLKKKEKTPHSSEFPIKRSICTERKDYLFKEKNAKLLSGQSLTF